MKPQRRFLRLWLAFVIGFLVLFLVLFCFSEIQTRLSPPPLSPLEAQLVGEWYVDNPGDTRSFFPDRTYSTSNRQFAGVWRIDNGRLTLTYWQPFELPHEYNFAGIKHSIRRTRKTTISWGVRFDEDGKQHILSDPGEGRPDEGQWLFHRLGDE